MRSLRNEKEVPDILFFFTFEIKHDLHFAVSNYLEAYMVPCFLVRKSKAQRDKYEAGTGAFCTEKSLFLRCSFYLSALQLGQNLNDKSSIFVTVTSFPI